MSEQVEDNTIFQVKGFDGSWTDIDETDAAEWTGRGRVVREVTIIKPMQIKCQHEPFEGRCVHCGVRFDFGRPMIGEDA